MNGGQQGGMAVFREPVQCGVREDRVKLVPVGQRIGAVVFYVEATPIRGFEHRQEESTP